ncbi:MAG: M14 family metallopeptidase [Proteobacteria bacterium]|nr:M14 family metallopeptidase [Pseudomonadota bacterium]
MPASDHHATLARLDRGFRHDYLDHDAITEQIHAWAEAFPDLVRVDSIGTSSRGRPLWLLTIGPEPHRIRPAVWIDANMHASELCGSSVALAIAEDALRVHLDAIDGGSQAIRELAGPVLERLRDVLFYVMPRISPDGAECILGNGCYVRSSPRDERPNRNLPRWRNADVNSDGTVLKMRVKDPTGEFVESTEIPNLMLLRRIEDSGPFYKVYPEGFIDNFDGFTVPTPSFLSDNQTDLNRNFPWFWAPDHEQAGAGPFPTSEPESRAVVEFASRHPNIFAWLNLHTFGGVMIRPLGDKPDNKMDRADLALYRQIGAWNEQFTGYPAVSGFEDFTYEPDKPLHGDLIDYAYHQRGCVAYVVELWDLFRQIGIKRPFKRFVDHYTQLTRDELIQLAQWDRDQNKSRVIRPWKSFDHPQLGAVEIGGVDTRIGLWNPPNERIAEICSQQSAAFLRVASLAPALTIGQVTRNRLPGDLTRVTVTVENRGYLPTYVLSSARNLDFCEPLFAECTTTGCRLDNPGDALHEIGHLDGWGRGLFDGTDALYYLTSRGNTGAHRFSFVVRGQGRARVRVGSCRTGWIDHTIDISAEMDCTEPEN